MVLFQVNLFICFQPSHLHLGLLSMSLLFGLNGRIAITAIKTPYQHASIEYLLRRGPLKATALSAKSTQGTIVVMCHK